MGVEVKVIDGKKPCSKCKEIKDVSEFTIKRNVKSGYSCRCKQCISDESPKKRDFLRKDTRRCNKCLKYKPFEEFSKDKGIKCNLGSYCKNCTNISNLTEENMLKYGFIYYIQKSNHR